MYTYCTLADTREQLNTSTTDTSADAVIRQANLFVKHRIDDMLQRDYFVPRIETRFYPPSAVSRNNSGRYTLYLNGYLLSATTITGFDNASELVVWDLEQATYTSADVYLEPIRRPPYARVVWLDYDRQPFAYQWLPDGRPPLLRLEGIWGYHSDYENAWVSSGDTLAAGITANDVSITVADVDGENAVGESPRFSAGNLIRIGSEYMTVIDTDTSANTIAVARGVLGSTAAPHSLSDSIDVWSVEPDIRKAAAKWATQVVAMRGNFQQVQVDGLGGATTFPQDAPEESMMTIRRYSPLVDVIFGA